ncbi:MAG TPA: VOC family protein [Terracidiphilus sp.]|jgi:catechol 2,3-dioxygenase-like lactoylglutathione lyase family enzyme|nr:VOC family protein [Terracidiphilus sp.]
MTLNTNLGKNSIVAFVTIVDVDKARTFYRDTLGLTLVREDLPFALVFDANGIMLRVSISKQRAALPGTVLGWDVPDIYATVRALESAGVAFERYGFLEQDAQGIWNSPTGAKVAWFKDPDENLLSLTEFAAD